MSRKKNKTDNILLPETVVTPHGSYTHFTGEESILPTLDYFRQAEIDKDRVNAVSRMLSLEAPVDPHNPSMSFPSVGLGILGVSDDIRNFIFGPDSRRRTCLYTVSSQYNDTPAAGNPAFSANPGQYGFKEVTEPDVGDVIQFWKHGTTPSHATMMTGYSSEGVPLISYSNGNVPAYNEWHGPNGEYETKDNLIKNREITDKPVQDLGTQHYYRYIGTPKKQQQIERRYQMLQNGDRIFEKGGFLQPRDAWDSLSMYEKAAMMKVAVKNGIYNLKDIRQKYNEFAEGGDTDNLTPWKALQNIDYVEVPDTAFTREKTGAGSIEVMFKDTPKEGYIYGTGYKYPHPKPGHNVVIYNPKENDAQDIRLDALHIMPQDATYDALRSELAYYADNSDISNNAKDRMEEDIRKYGHLIPGMSYQDYYNNEVDGFLRNMFIEGSPEYIQSKRYYPNLQQLRDWNADLMPYVDRIYDYLITGQRPANILPEITIAGKKHSIGGPFVEAAMNEYKSGGKIYIKPENRGKFTALKKRTGHSASWFKAHGTPAQKKMATFALNAAKWKHGEGGSLVKNLFYPGGDITYGRPFYSYDENGRMILDEKGNPILNYNAFLSDTVITPQKEETKYNINEDRRSDSTTKGTHEGVIPFNAGAGQAGEFPLFALADAIDRETNMTRSDSPIYKPGLIAGEPLLPVFGKVASPNVTERLLKWLGKPLNKLPRNPLSPAQIIRQKGLTDEQRMELLQQDAIFRAADVDMSKLDLGDLFDAYDKREALLRTNRPSRFSLVKPAGVNGFNIYDNIVSGEDIRRIGTVNLYGDADNNLHMGNIHNWTRFDGNKIGNVQERGLSAAINTTKSIGGKGVITGEQYQNAPLQLHVLDKFPNKTPLWGYGNYSNVKAVNDYYRNNKNILIGERYVDTIDEMRAASPDKYTYLNDLNAPAFLIEESPLFVPTKSSVFDPSRLTEDGKMNIDWSDYFVFRKGGKLKR